MLRQQRMLPDLAFLDPVRLAARPAIGDAERRRVADTGLAEEAQHVLIEHRLRDIVLQGRVTVLDDGDVLAEQRRALGAAGDILFLRGLHLLLALIVARLVVVLDRVRALDLRATNWGNRFKSGRASCRERVCQYV